MIQKPLDVGVEYITVPLPMELSHPRNRLMTVASRSEAVGVVVKDLLEERTEEAPEHLLSNAIADGGDTQGPGFAIAFGDMDASQGEGPKGPILELSRQGLGVVVEVILEQRDTDLVNPRCTAITFHAAEGQDNQSVSDPPGQRVRFDLGHTQVLSC